MPLVSFDTPCDVLKEISGIERNQWYEINLGDTPCDVLKEISGIERNQWYEVNLGIFITS